MEQTQRIHGFDLARAVAVIGMAYAHLALFNFPGAQLPNGYASALFAVLAGASVSIMSNRGQKLLLRGVVILGIGVVLMSAQTGIIVVLESIAWIIFLLGPVARWAPSRIALLLVGLITLGPALSSTALHLGFYTDILNGSYPVLAWLAYGTLGVLIHRVLREKVWVQAGCVPLGALAVGLTYPLRYPDFDARKVVEPGFWDDYFSLYPHTGGVLDVLLCMAFSAAVISACLLICRLPLATGVLFPLRAVGSMALTFYVLHVLTAGWFVFGPVDLQGPALNGPVTYSSEPLEKLDPSWWKDDPFAPNVGETPTALPGGNNDFFLGTLLVSVIAAPLWKLRFRRGPMEEMVAAIVRAGDKQS